MVAAEPRGASSCDATSPLRPPLRHSSARQGAPLHRGRDRIVRPCTVAQHDDVRARGLRAPPGGAVPERRPARPSILSRRRPEAPRAFSGALPGGPRRHAIVRRARRFLVHPGTGADTECGGGPNVDRGFTGILCSVRGAPPRGAHIRCIRRRRNEHAGRRHQLSPVESSLRWTASERVTHARGRAVPIHGDWSDAPRRASTLRLLRCLAADRRRPLGFDHQSIWAISGHASQARCIARCRQIRACRRQRTPNGRAHAKASVVGVAVTDRRLLLRTAKRLPVVHPRHRDHGAHHRLRQFGYDDDRSRHCAPSRDGDLYCARCKPRRRRAPRAHRVHGDCLRRRGARPAAHGLGAARSATRHHSLGASAR